MEKKFKDMTWYEKHDLWDRHQVDQYFRKKYQLEIDNLLEGMEANDQIFPNDEITWDEENMSYVKWVYLGNVLELFPSGKYYMPWTTNQTWQDVYKDEIYQEELERKLKEYGYDLTSGEGDATDLYAVKSWEDPFEHFYTREKARALAEHLGLHYGEFSDIEEINEREYEYRKIRYLVLEENEKDNLLEDKYHQYIDDIVLPEIPEQYHEFFNEEKFRERLKSEDDGFFLSYDGQVYEVTDPESGEKFFIFMKG